MEQIGLCNKQENNSNKKFLLGVVVGLTIILAVVFFIRQSTVFNEDINPKLQEGIISQAEENFLFNSTSKNEKVKTKVHATGINISKWNDEVEMFIELPQVVNYEDLGDGKIRIYHGQTEGIFYMKDDNTFEWEIVTNRAPNFDCITFPMQSKNLNFYYQPPMNERGYTNFTICNSTYCNPNGNIYEMDSNIVGSYAVYHNSKRDNEYKTGKAFHIDRPFVNHSQGSNWLSLNITENSFGICGFDDLPNGARDLVIDPTFGYLTCGSTGLVAGDSISYANFTATASGTVDSMTSCTASYESPTAYHGIYDSTGTEPGDLIEEETTGYTSGDWASGAFHEVDMAGTTELSSGTSYWLAVVADSSSEAGFRVRADYISYRWGGNADEAGTTFPATASAILTGNDADYLFSIFANYTVGGGGDSCTCTGSADWVVDCSDNCVLETACNMREFNLYLQGTGSFTKNAPLLIDNMSRSPNCKFNNLSGLSMKP